MPTLILQVRPAEATVEIRPRTPADAPVRQLRPQPDGRLVVELPRQPHRVRVRARGRVEQHLVVDAEQDVVRRRLTLLLPGDRPFRVGGMVRSNPTRSDRIGVVFSAEMSLVRVRRTLSGVAERVRLDTQRIAERVAASLDGRDLDEYDREELAEWLEEMFDELFALGGDPEAEAEWLADLGGRDVEPPVAVEDLDPAIIIGKTGLVDLDGRGVETGPASMPPIQLEGRPASDDWSAALAILRQNPEVTAGPLVRDDEDAPAVLTHRVRVRLFPDVSPGQLFELADRLELTVAAVDPAVPGLVTLAADPGIGDEIDAVAEALLATGDVRFAEPVIGGVSPAHGDFLAALQWDRRQIGLPTAHALIEQQGLTLAADIVAGIVDGAMPLRPDELQSPDLRRADGRDRLHCVDPVRRALHHGAGHDPHGLQVAGVFGAGGRHDGADGFGTVGVAPDSELVAMRLPSELDVADAGLLWLAGLATERFGDFRPPAPVDVLVCSRGLGALPGLRLDAEHDQTLSPASATILRVVATRGRGGRGVPIFFSAGNDGRPIALGAPYATSPDVLGCGASEVRAGDGERVWPKSNVGPALDLYAPGRLDGHSRTLTVAPHMRASMPARPLVSLTVGAGPLDARLDLDRRTLAVPDAVVSDLPAAGGRVLLHDPISGQFDCVVTAHRRQVAEHWVYSWQGQVLHPYGVGTRVHIGDRVVGRLLADWQPGAGPLTVPAHPGLADARDVMLRADGIWLAVGFDADRLDDGAPPVPRRAPRRPAPPSLFGSPFAAVDDIVARVKAGGAPTPRAAPAAMYLHPTTPIPEAFECRADRTDVWLSSSSADGGFGSTSAANPLCAGVAALVLAVDPTFTAPEVARILRETAVGLAGPMPYGAGRVDAARAVEQALRERADRAAGRYRSDLFITPPTADGACDAIRICGSDALDDDGQPGPDVSPRAPAPRWVYVRVENRGPEPSPPAWLRVVLAPTRPGGLTAHAWPTSWRPGPADGPRLIGEVAIEPIPGHGVRWLSVFWPGALRPVGPADLLVEVSPHDGPVAGGTIATNDNLSGRLVA